MGFILPFILLKASFQLPVHPFSARIYPRHYNIISHGTSSTPSSSQANSLVHDVGSSSDFHTTIFVPVLIDFLALLDEVQVNEEAMRPSHLVAPSNSLPHDTSIGEVGELFPWRDLLRSTSYPFLLCTIHQ
ncbi:hypothetical protein PVK06_005599 [Gossypium arboreum]|uniref:Uncharacterized protein n=1 Tax=Gossypium arboreum TaxID=29729 RepID=A0ABR0QW04_GOSAR|nr:hypothetical protein PVK06_005599 [Gossypium arboreum]